MINGVTSQFQVFRNTLGFEMENKQWWKNMLSHTFQSRDSNLTTSPRDGDKLKKDVDMYKHIHVLSQHIYIFCYQ